MVCFNNLNFRAQNRTPCLPVPLLRELGVLFPHPDPLHRSDSSATQSSRASTRAALPWPAPAPGSRIRPLVAARHGESCFHANSRRRLSAQSYSFVQKINCGVVPRGNQGLIETWRKLMGSFSRVSKARSGDSRQAGGLLLVLCHPACSYVCLPAASCARASAGPAARTALLRTGGTAEGLGVARLGGCCCHCRGFCVPFWAGEQWRVSFGKLFPEA